MTKTIRHLGLSMAVVLPLLSACSDGGPTDGGTDNDPTFNLSISAAYVVQAIQTREGGVPLVADRDAYVRVFAVGNEANQERPSVRVRFYRGSTEVASYLIPAGSGAVATSVDQAALGTSWNIKVPGSVLQVGTRMLAEVDPDDAIDEANEADNRFPATGTPQELDILEVPPFRLRMVPVETADGRRGNLTAANLDSYLTYTRKLHPISEMQVELRDVYTTKAQTFDTGGNVWASVVAELDAVRVAEAGDPWYYYGIVNPPYNGGGVVGIANGIPSRTSIGWDRFPDAPETVAHELGHNFGRRHAPCGGAGGSDPEFPYAQGFVGAFGMDTETGELKDPTLTDIMGYCDSSWWVSDYTFTNVLHYRRQADQPATSASVLLVWGRVGPDGIVLEPAFEVRAAPVIPRAGGDYRLEGFDARGGRLFSYSFAGSPLGDGPEGVRTFAFALPASSIGIDRLATLQVSGRGEIAKVRAEPVGTGAQRGAVSPFVDAEVRRAGASSTELRWDAARYPMVMVRDAATGTILSLGRGGEARVVTDARELELVYSNGVRSVTRQMVVVR